MLFAAGCASTPDDGLLASTAVVSLPHPERKSVLVEANGLFLTDIPGTSSQLEATFRAPYAFDARNSSIVKVRSTDDMATFTSGSGVLFVETDVVK